MREVTITKARLRILPGHRAGVFVCFAASPGTIGGGTSACLTASGENKTLRATMSEFGVWRNWGIPDPLTFSFGCSITGDQGRTPRSANPDSHDERMLGGAPGRAGLQPRRNRGSHPLVVLRRADNHPGARRATPPESGGDLAEKLPSSDEEGWRAARRGGADKGIKWWC